MIQCGGEERMSGYMDKIKCVWGQLYIYTTHSRVGPTGFLQRDDDAKLKIDEF